MSGWRPRSVRSRTTLAASLATVLVLAAASVLIVVLVERDLENNARVALEGALETASHAASGEGSARGEGNEQSESSGHTEGNGAAESSGLSPAVPDSESSSDARLQQIADASIAETRAGVDAASRALWIIVPAVGAILALAIWAAVGHALRPVRAIAGRVAAISGSTLDERVPEPDSGDEIAERRLRALPFAARCKDCEEVRETERNRERVLESRSKAIALFSTPSS